MKLTKGAERLLVSAFTRNGKVMCSAVDTSEGSMPLWGQLVIAGFVAQAPQSSLGHPFSYSITKAGEAYLDALEAQA